jgi:hypothetical protein
MGLTVECPLAIPLLLGLWAEADDSGSFEWKPLTLKARVLPAATCDTLALLAVLVAANFIMRFEIDGRPVGVIRNFVKFQRPKAPIDSHPFTSESRAFAGFESDGRRPHSGTGRPPAKDNSERLPNDFVTPTENPPQMKEEGCRRKEEEPTSQDSTQTELSAPLDAPKPGKRTTGASREPSAREILSECLSEQTTADLIAHRKAKRSPITSRAARLLVEAFRAYGDPEKAAQAMLLRGWTGFKPEWMHEDARAGPTNKGFRRSEWAI